MASFNSNFDITGGYHRRVRKKLPQADPCDATAALEDLGWLQQQLGCFVNLSMDWFKEFLYRKAHFFITNITMHLMDFNGKITMVSGVSGEKNIPRKPTHCYYVHTCFFPCRNVTDAVDSWAVKVHQDRFLHRLPKPSLALLFHQRDNLRALAGFLFLWRE